MAMYKFILFVTARTARSEQALANLRRMLDEGTDAEYELTVCDVLDEPDQAEQYKIMATPALVRTSPSSPIRIVGDFSDAGLLQPYLGLLIPREDRMDGVAVTDPPKGPGSGATDEEG